MEPNRWGVMLWKVKGWHREEVYVKQRVFGSVSTGNLIPCQTAQVKAGEREVRKYKIGGVKLAGAAEEAVLFCFVFFPPCPAEKAVIILIPDC